MVDEQIKKMCYIYTMNYYSPIKTTEILSFSATWMKMENIMLSKTSQTQKDKHYILSFICVNQ
jgi:hypothetical protein